MMLATKLNIFFFFNINVVTFFWSIFLFFPFAFDFTKSHAIPFMPELKNVPERIPIGALFSHGYTQLQTIFKQSIHRHNSDASQKFIVETVTEFVDHNDPARMVRQLQCLHFNRGIYAFLAPNFATSAYQSALSFANTYRVPLVGLPPIFSFHDRSHNEFYGLNLEPNFWPAILSVLKWYSWNQIIYLYDSDDGIFNLQELMRQAHRSDHSIQLSTVKRIANAGEGYKMLKALDKQDKESMKYVILNCNLHISKALIAYHIQDTAMERERFHYLLTNLMLNESWSKETSSLPAAFNAVNITSFALPAYRGELMKLYEIRREADFYYRQDEIPTLDEVLTYDGTKVLLEAFNLVVKSQINITKALDTEPVIATANNYTLKTDATCPTLKLFRFGETIANHLKIIKTHGITGNIEFHSNGFRKNYSIEVLEISRSGLFEKVGTWSDLRGMSISHPNRLKTSETTATNQNMTYLVTSILEEPFLMKIGSREKETLNSNDKYEGYVKDLADLLADKLNFGYEIRIVNDSKYGSMKGGLAWSGMMGELVRNEVDMAIAPLTINAERQKVIDFTQPFMTTAISIMMKKPSLTNDLIFLPFLRPLSIEVWACIIIAFFLVSFVFYVASKLSVKQSAENNTQISYCASLCYTFGILVYQVAGIFPRSISSRITIAVWWLFVFVTVTSYLANLTAYSVTDRLQLTILSVLGKSDVSYDPYFYYDKMLLPITSIEDLSNQDLVRYGLLKHSSTEAFFMNSKESLYAKMWHKMNSAVDVLVDSYEEGVMKVKQSEGDYAFILESAMNEFINSRQPCDSIKVGKNFHEIGYGIALPLGSPMREKLNRAILTLKESGELEQLRRKWWNERHQCNILDEKIKTKSGIYTTIFSIAGVSLVLIMGLIIAFLVAILEYLCQRSNRENDYAVKQEERENNSTSEERRTAAKKIESTMICKK